MYLFNEGICRFSGSKILLIIIYSTSDTSYSAKVTWKIRAVSLGNCVGIVFIWCSDGLLYHSW